MTIASGCARSGTADRRARSVTQLATPFLLLFPCLPFLCVVGQEFDWLLDFISSFLRSPTWTTPLNNFIDEVRITQRNTRAG